jgi:hypothetical protein
MSPCQVVRHVYLYPNLILACVRLRFSETVGTRTDRLCGLVVKVLGYRSGGPGSIPGTTRKKK